MNIIWKKFPKGEQINLEYSFYQTKLGKIIVVSYDTSLVFVGFAPVQAGAVAEIKKRFPKARLVKKETKVQKKVINFLKSPQKKESTFTATTKGSPFQLRVWKVLLHIPFGETCFYSDLAKAIKQPTATRAVASAVAANPLALLVPCHRVLPRSGGVGNYHWGSKNKSSLLTWERITTRNK